MSGAQVLVVGGGLAGLSAATSLRDAGCSVRVIERAAAPGGRVRGEEREGFRLYFPVTTAVLLSLVATLLYWLFRR